jgi:copper chaperone CopZ
MRRVTLAVVGMDRRRCVRRATARVRDVDGVQTVTADRDSGSIVVLGDVTSAALLDALAATGFTPTVIQDVAMGAP